KRLRDIFDRKARDRQHDDIRIPHRFFNIRRDIRKFDEFLIHPVIEYDAPPFSDSFKIPGKLRRLVKGHRDRKSTRLNSSHVSISYAVFCLKKKKTTK